ncbi:MAG: glycosyltransferase family 1 protein [Kiritimatiellia bacterium]
MRIGLNLLHALPEIGGGWNYIANLIAALNDEDRENQYIAFVTGASESLVPLNSRFTVVRCPVDSRSRLARILFENTVLQVLAGRYRLDCFHWFANTQAILNRVPALVTVYDLQPFLNYARYGWGKRIYLRGMMRMTARHAPMLLPMSQATAEDLRALLEVETERMTVIRVIIDSLFQPAPLPAREGMRQKYNLPEQFWLYVAHGYPHKNHTRLLQAYHEMKINGRKPWPLVLRGDGLQTADSIRRPLTQFGLESDVIFLPRLERRELPLLYSAASALIFPSLYEGGGIPVVEAMACGCPVTASYLPPIKEFIDNAALYFDPLNVQSMADSMLTFERNSDLRMQCREKGLLRANDFRAERIIPILLKAYHQVVKH